MLWDDTWLFVPQEQRNEICVAEGGERRKGVARGDGAREGKANGAIRECDRCVRPRMVGGSLTCPGELMTAVVVLLAKERVLEQLQPVCQQGYKKGFQTYNLKFFLLRWMLF